jgi:hypothetical protein
MKVNLRVIKLSIGKVGVLKKGRKIVFVRVYGRLRSIKRMAIPTTMIAIREAMPKPKM